MVRYGMVWYGMVRYGMVQYGMVRYGMVWYTRGHGVLSRDNRLERDDGKRHCSVVRTFNLRNCALEFD